MTVLRFHVGQMEAMLLETSEKSDWGDLQKERTSVICLFQVIIESLSENQSQVVRMAPGKEARTEVINS